MERPKAIALAVALTMSVGSGVVALGANAGALGFGHPASTVATQTVAPAVAGGIQPAGPRGTAPAHEHDDGGYAAESASARATTTKGEQ